MRNKSVFRANVLVGCLSVIFLCVCLGAVGQRGHRHAKAMVCLANLHQWGQVFNNFAQEHDGSIALSDNAWGYWWTQHLDASVLDWKTNKSWFCPEATEPIFDENLVKVSESNVFSAWGIDPDLGVEPNGLAGSYGLNGYCIDISNDGFYDNGMSGQDGWTMADAHGGSNIPLFMDALRFDLWPQESEAPAQEEDAAWSNISMARCAINRHCEGINILFLDLSARKVDLKELWTLQWHRSFNTAGPWTLAGGVQPEDWPEWIRNFQDY